MRAWALGLAAAMAISSSALSEPLRESSSSFESDQIAPFLNRVATVIDSGFGPGESEAVVQLITSLKAGDEGDRSFTVKYEGRETPLHVHVVVGPLESARIRFLTSPELANRIQKERNILLDDLAK